MFSFSQIRRALLKGICASLPASILTGSAVRRLLESTQWNKEGLISWRGSADQFEINFEPLFVNQSVSLRDTVSRRLSEIDGLRNSQSLAVLYSGGVDSEIIATEAIRLGIPSQFYFLDAFGQNDVLLENIRNFERRHAVQVHRIRPDQIEFESRLDSLIGQTGLWSPHYLLMTHFLESLPKNEFVVMGEGDFNRGRVELHQEEYLNSIKLVQDGRGGRIHFPTHWADVVFLEWSKRANRTGEFYFYRSSAELIVATLTHPMLQCGSRGLSKRDIYLDAYPEIQSRPYNRTFPRDTFVSKKLFKQIEDIASHKKMLTRPYNYMSEVRWHFV